MKTTHHVLIKIIVSVILIEFISCGCPVSDNPSQMFQCLTINPQAFIDLISKGDYKSFCHMANGYMTCMTTYVRDCLGGKAATGILEELQDLNLKCCISGRNQECVIKNPSLLSKCFSLDNDVMMADGNLKPIKECKIGDSVKAVDKYGNLVDSEIIEIFHKHSNMSTLFTVFYDSNQNKISLTGSHLINVLTKGYVKASDVQIGDKLRIYSEKDKMFKELIIERIEYQIKQGFVAPLTNHGTILVNGVDASCYADINSQYLADMSMMPVKFWYKISKILNWKMDTENSDIIKVSKYFNILHSLTYNYLPFLFK